MGFLQSARQRLGSAAHSIGKHAATVGKVALGAAAVAGAAYHAYQTHSDGQARLAQADWQAERGRQRYEELIRQAPHRQHTSPPAGSELWRGRTS